MRYPGFEDEIIMIEVLVYFGFSFIALSGFPAPVK